MPMHPADPPQTVPESSASATGQTFLPFNTPYFSGRELEYVRDVLATGKVAGNGAFTKQCEMLLGAQLGRPPRVLLTTSCTDALEMAALLIDIQLGDEFIVPSFTFVSSANAFVLRGARPVFADVRPDTLNIDEERVERLITPRTRAIVVVHYAGVGCEMNRLTEIAERAGVALIEDNAHGLFGSYQGQPLGSFGALSTLSFHETKNITCGEGGALVVNDPVLVERAEILHEKGTDRSRFFRGEIDKYSWGDVGSSFLPSDLLAAVLFAQLECAVTIQARRQRLFDFYASQLGHWAQQQRVRLPYIPEICEQAYHMFYMLFPGPDSRDAFLAHMKTRNILSVFHYLPLHLSPMGQRFGGRAGDCPVTEQMSATLARLPFSASITESEMQRVVDAVTDFETGVT